MSWQDILKNDGIKEWTLYLEYYTKHGYSAPQYDREHKFTGTEEEANADPDNVWNPGLDSYDPDWGEEPLQKTKSIQYTEFVAPLIKAVQELSAKVDALEKG